MACSASDCAGTPAAPVVDGVYVTDQLRDPEGFGERIDDDLPTDDGDAFRAALVEELGPREVFPEPRQDAAAFGAPRISDRAPKMGTADRGQWGDH